MGELQLGFRGELTMSPAMETLADCLFMEKIPATWAKHAFASTRPLLSWLANLKDRCGQLNDWVADPHNIPKIVDIAKLFNPQSFLTAIKQLCCQQQQLELDKLQVYTEVTKPVVNCKATMISDREEKNIYICPAYCVPTRRPYFVFPAQLRTKQPAAKWVLAGVAIILDIGIAI